MISIVLVLILAWSFYIGYSRGLILQGFYTFMAVLAGVIASQLYRSFAQQISLLVPYANPQNGATTYFFSSQQIFELDQVFYAGLAFLILYTIVYSLGRFVGIFLHLLPLRYLDERTYNVAAGLCSVFVTLFGLQMMLTVLATIPMDLVQTHLNNSGLVRFLVNHVPITTSLLKNLWVTKIIG
ncbi:CvpA family protein [Streptococcus himalayensis]|uniref:Colicin V production protein n=1 Tax=Streptococcus himalayensis TaxID=1888195 RepID=A0A917A945_9STRE|nr:CvpA family protein [Streptococcus himalayensis]GGE36190.1 colicin V production protein [Streptococcus himalayensis]